MAKNLGATTLKSRKRSGNPMQDYDNLPPELRRWLSEAALLVALLYSEPTPLVSPWVSEPAVLAS